MTQSRWRGLIILFGCVVAAGIVRAEIPRMINYQGKLSELDGTPLRGDHSVTLRFYDSETGGTSLWRELHTVNIAKDDRGLFTVILGSVIPFPETFNFNQPLWLTTEVDEAGELLPRQQLSAVSYALNTDAFKGLDVTSFVQADDLSDAEPSEIGRSGLSGTSTGVARADHTHRGMRSLAIEGSARLSQDVTVAAGDNIRLSQLGQTITIAGIGIGGGDLTSVAAGVGLTGGGDEGDVTIDVVGGPGLIVEEDQVRVDLGTEAGQVIQLDGAGRLPAVDGSQLTPLTVGSSDVTDGALAAVDTSAEFLTAGPGVTLEKTEASWQISAVGSGGDISAVVAGDGLAGGGTAGEVTLAVIGGTGIIVSGDAVHVDIGTGANQIVQLDETGALPPLNGAQLTQLNASALSSGTVVDERLSSNVSLLGASIGTFELENEAVAEANLAENSVGASALSAIAIQPGDVQPEDLPAHASSHQPGGADALPTGEPDQIGTVNLEGTSSSLARADHQHEGLRSIAVSGRTRILGDAALVAGENITLSQEGRAITIAASGAGAFGARMTTSASDAVEIHDDGETQLIAVTLTKQQTSSIVLLLATVQLEHIGNPNSKTVDVRLFRGSTALGGAYRVRIGQANRAVSEVPVTVHTLDAAGKGTHTYSLRARASGGGAQATVRQLTAIELL